MSRVIQVVTTVDNRETAAVITRAVVQHRVAACGQIVGPIESTYWWNGAIDTSEEWLCIFKRTEDLYPELEATIREHHPYDVPEILAMSVVTGHSAYTDWLRAELRGNEGSALRGASTQESTG